MCLKSVYIIFYNNAVALVKPNGITAYLQSYVFIQKVVFHLSAAAILMWLYLFNRFNLVDYFPYLVLSSNSLIGRRRYVFGILRAFKSW